MQGQRSVRLLDVSVAGTLVDAQDHAATFGAAGHDSDSDTGSTSRDFSRTLKLEAKLEANL